MIQAEFKVCYIDGKFTHKSLAYKLLKLCLTEEVADKLTYSVTIPKDDP